MPKRFYKASSPLIPYRGKYENEIRGALFCLLLLIQTGCAGFRTCGPDDSWRGNDKFKHFAAASVIGAGATAIASSEYDSGDAAVIGMSTAMAAGLGKEWYDLRVKNTCFSWKDLAWDFLGASVGVSLAAWATD